MALKNERYACIPSSLVIGNNPSLYALPGK